MLRGYDYPVRNVSRDRTAGIWGFSVFDYMQQYQIMTYSFVREMGLYEICITDGKIFPCRH